MNNEDENGFDIMLAFVLLLLLAPNSPPAVVSQLVLVCIALICCCCCNECEEGRIGLAPKPKAEGAGNKKEPRVHWEGVDMWEREEEEEEMKGE